MTDNNKRLRKYILSTEYFKTSSMVRRKRDTYVEPGHRKIKKQKTDIPQFV